MKKDDFTRVRLGMTQESLDQNRIRGLEFEVSQLQNALREVKKVLQDVGVDGEIIIQKINKVLKGGKYDA